MNLDITKYSIEDLVSLRNKIDNHITSYEDKFLYICNVRSYGRNWIEHVNNTHTLQELCYRYFGDDGIVDIYSTNPNLSHIENYGDVKYIVSEDDYNKWKEYEYMKNQIPQIIKELDKWDDRDNVPFNNRPMFELTYTREDLAKWQKELDEFDMSFIPPSHYERE